MKREMDKIQFEYRAEIEDVFSAMAIYLKEHPNAKEKKSIKVLMDKLEVMHMEW